MVADSGCAADNGGLSKGGEGRGARRQMAGWGGLCNKCHPMMKTVGQPGNENNLTII